MNFTGTCNTISLSIIHVCRVNEHNLIIRFPYENLTSETYVRLSNSSFPPMFVYVVIYEFKDYIILQLVKWSYNGDKLQTIDNLCINKFKYKLPNDSQAIVSIIHMTHRFNFVLNVFPRHEESFS